MTKEAIKLSIDSEVLGKAKRQIPNMSQFFEECLKQYLGIGGNLIHTSQMHQLVETISKSQLELYLMNERSNIEEAREQAKKDEINLAWRRLYTTYRDQRIINKDYLHNASEILEVPEEELTDIVQVCFAFSRNDNVDVTEWEEVYEHYGYGDA